ncbi:MAG: cobalamin biosynthesis protein [Oscillospiraceae bacterium]|nr:cobalamin biosynthesis protein [Oscillospiraceae bacterium]
MIVSIISITRKGLDLSKKICNCFIDDHSITRYAFYKSCDENAVSFSDINSLTVSIFQKSDAVIFVSACGIAVRSIAPIIKSKVTDPAVLVVDDNGKFVIPILSGHLGGANTFAKVISEKIDAVPVITTATDIGGKFSPDSFAKANDLIITDMTAAKEIASAVLSNEKIGFVSDYEYINIPSDIAVNQKCRTGICVSADTAKKSFEITLNLVPKNIVIGIGCKRGTACDSIERHVSEGLRTVGIDEKRICAVTTIDIKSDEKGLSEYCEKHKLKLFTYTAEELMKVDGEFAKSEFVLAQTGADNVCERSVVKYGGKLIISKISSNGVTVAAGEMPVCIDFSKEII